MKPVVDLSDFQRLDLRVGTIVHLQRLGSLDLMEATIDVGERVAALLPISAAERLAVRTRVAVAVSLHPLAAHGSIYTAFIIAALIEGIDVPDGSRVS
jgi:tRNA-binding EMAP/Myf-like protein